MGHLVPDGVKQGAQGAVETVVPEAHLNPLLVRKKSVTDKLNSFVIDIVVGGLSQFFKHFYDEQLDFVRLQERKKDWTDKGNHESVGIGSAG